MKTEQNFEHKFPEHFQCAYFWFCSDRERGQKCESGVIDRVIFRVHSAPVSTVVQMTHVLPHVLHARFTSAILSEFLSSLLTWNYLHEAVVSSHQTSA